jgi:hypothetical protein
MHNGALGASPDPDLVDLFRSTQSRHMRMAIPPRAPVAGSTLARAEKLWIRLSSDLLHYFPNLSCRNVTAHRTNDSVGRGVATMRILVRLLNRVLRLDKPLRGSTEGQFLNWRRTHNTVRIY